MDFASLETVVAEILISSTVDRQTNQIVGERMLINQIPGPIPRDSALPNLGPRN